MQTLNPCGWRHLILQLAAPRPLPALDECEDGLALCDYFDRAADRRQHDEPRKAA